MTLILFLFFLSGAIGLINEVVWVRMLLYIFGTTTYSVVVVLSTFMAGLALGSSILGKMSDKKKDPIKFYAFLEIMVGVFSLLTLILFPLVQQIYRSVYSFLPNPTVILLVKLILSSLSILPATFFMGGTLPTLIGALTKHREELGGKTALLYAVNTFGAAIGTLFAGFIAIELFGLSKTVILACLGNFLIAGIIYALFKKPLVEKNESQIETRINADENNYDNNLVVIVFIAFGISGLISMAYEVALTRLLTPSVGTYIYAFSGILALFLTGIALGSFLSKFILKRTNKLMATFGFLEMGIGLFSVVTLLVTSRFIDTSMIGKVILTILPSTILMGATFPIATSILPTDKRVGFLVGALYSANTIGSIVGPIIAGFLLLPFLGTTKTILLLAVVNLTLAIILIIKEKNWDLKPSGIFVGALALTSVLILLIFYPEKLYEKQLADNLEKFKTRGFNYLYKEDETAAVLGFANPQDIFEAAVLVDGVSMSGLVPETKMMAHIPLFLLPDPKRVLVICFGMGTTFRSALSHNLEVDAVELVPSVPDTFTLFYKDAKEVLNNPKGKIIINDGRNYVFLTKKKYDVITIDPPPPLNSAQTTVLYSKEFYQQAKEILTDNGIFTQWIFFHGSRQDDTGMLVKSFTDVFPNVEVFRGSGGWGLYLMGSKSKINIDKTLIAQRMKDERVAKDLNEWRGEPYTLDQIMEHYVGDKSKLEILTADVSPVTDDRPRTEYFLLRQKFSKRPIYYYLSDFVK